MAVTYERGNSVATGVSPWDDSESDPFEWGSIKLYDDANCLVSTSQIANANAVDEIHWIRLKYPAITGPYTYQYFTEVWSGYTSNVGTAQINLQSIWTLLNPDVVDGANYKIQVYLTGLEANGQLDYRQTILQFGEVESIADGYYGSTGSVTLATSNIADIVVGLASTLQDNSTLTWEAISGTENVQSLSPIRTTYGNVHVGGGDGELTIPWGTDGEIAYNIAINLIGATSGSEIPCGTCLRNEPFDNDIGRKWEQMLLNIDATAISLYEEDEEKLYTPSTSRIN